MPPSSALSNGDNVKIVSATNPKGMWDFGPGGKKEMIATVKVVEGMRPGVLPNSWAVVNLELGRTVTHYVRETGRRAVNLCGRSRLFM